jgi:hypothetical protein
MRRSLEGRGWKSPTPRRRRRPSSPGPPPILWSSSARTDRPLVALPAPPLLLAPCTASPPPLGAAGPFRCRLQRNDPGWFVGEQRHVIFLLPATAAAEDLGTLAATEEEVEHGAEAMAVPGVLVLVGWPSPVPGAAAFIRDTRPGRRRDRASASARLGLQRLSRGCLVLACSVRVKKARSTCVLPRVRTPL